MSHESDNRDRREHIKYAIGHNFILLNESFVFEYNLNQAHLRFSTTENRYSVYHRAPDHKNAKRYNFWQFWEIAILLIGRLSAYCVTHQNNQEKISFLRNLISLAQECLPYIKKHKTPKCQKIPFLMILRDGDNFWLYKVLPIVWHIKNIRRR